MRTTYEKLVRDEIPAIIERTDTRCAVETMADDEYRAALLAKLVEEAGEAAEAARESLLAELADVAEVLDGLLRINGFTRSELEVEQAGRRSERGGFERRLRLLWTESLNPAPVAPD